MSIDHELALDFLRKNEIFWGKPQLLCMKGFKTWTSTV